MDKLIQLLQDPAFYTVLAGLLAMIKAVGELLDKIGAMIEGPDQFETIGAKIGKAVAWAGKALKWLSPGHGGFK